MNGSSFIFPMVSSYFQIEARLYFNIFIIMFTFSIQIILYIYSQMPKTKC
jgi:hypothetical protein